MFRSNLLIQTIVLLLSTSIVVVLAQTSTLDCIYQADGYSYNFGRLATLVGYKYSASKLNATGSDSFYVNVCNTAFGCTAFGGPSGMTGCRKTSPYGYIGYITNGTFSSYPDAGKGAYLTYTSSTGNTLHLTLLCDPSKLVATVISGGEVSTNAFEFVISGVEACGSATI